MATQTVLALVPARGGSRGVPRKNIRSVGGVPLLVHSIRAGLDCPLVDRCVVSTEDAEIKMAAQAAGAEVIDRPAALAGDATGAHEVTAHVLDVLAGDGWTPDIVVLLQPTSPLRTASHVSAALTAFLASDAAALISVTPMEHHPHKSVRIVDGCLVPVFAREDMERPRQELPPIYRPNGAIFAIRTEVFLKTNRFFSDPTLPFVMTPEDSLDIDTTLDLRLADYVLNSSDQSRSRQ